MRSQLPRIIRPDLMAGDDGTLRATELDSVPGGFGTLAALTRRYADLGFDPVGGAEGIPHALGAMFREVAEATIRRWRSWWPTSPRTTAAR